MKNWFQITLASLILAFLPALVDAKSELFIILKPKHLNPKPSTGMVLGRLSIVYTDRRISNFRLKCKHIETGDIVTCMRSSNRQNVNAEKFGKRKSSRYRKSINNLYRLQQGNYSVDSLVVSTRIAYRSKGSNLMDSDTIDLSQQNINFEVKEGANYVGRLNFKLTRDSLFRLSVSDYSLTSDIQNDLDQLAPKISQLASQAFQSPHIALKPVFDIQSISIVRKGRWTSLDQSVDWQSYCDKKWLVHQTKAFSKAVVDKGKFYIPTNRTGFPVYTSTGFSKSVECGLYNFFSSTDFSEFRQKGRVNTQKGKDWFGGGFYKDHVFEVEFR